MNKIIFGDGTAFDAAENPVETEPPIFSKKMRLNGEARDVIRVTVAATHAEATEKFVPGAVWAIRQFNVSPEGVELETFTDFDKSNYCVAGDIVDHRDGRVTVYMGKPTESELLRDTVDELILAALEV